MVLRHSCCVAIVLLCTTGCAVGGKSFSMDSTSRTPYFGLSLMPKARDKSDNINRAMRQDAPGKVATADRRTTSESNGLLDWLPGRTKPDAESALPMESIPLPRTDRPSAPAPVGEQPAPSAATVTSDAASF